MVYALIAVAVIVVLLGLTCLLLLLRPPVWLMRRFTISPAHVVFDAPEAGKVIALTIDDGPDPISTLAILATLREHEVRATFFPWATTAARHGELLRQIVAEGHELGNHLLEDYQCWELPLEKFTLDLREADHILRVAGPVLWFRPPGGMATSAQYREIQGWGYRSALGSVFPYDTSHRWANFSAAFVLWNVRPGGIIVLHDGPRRGHRTVQVLRRILPTLKQRGYRVVTLSALMAAAEESSNA